MPISACVGRRDLIERAWPKSTGEALHTSTFLGHPVACAAAIASINAIVSQNLASRALSAGKRFRDGLISLSNSYPSSITDVRGMGLMLGFQMPSHASAQALMLAMLSAGLIVLLAGDDGDVVEITPPLMITNAQIDWCLDRLARYFAKL